MEVIAETVFAVGFGTLALVYFASVLGTMTCNPLELLKVFFIPGYALLTAWSSYAWIKPVFLVGCGITVVGLIFLMMD